MRLRIIAADGSASEVAAAAAAVRLGRDPACEVPFDQAVFPMVSGRHAKIERIPDGCILTPLSQTNKTLLNDQSIEAPARVKAGDRIRLGVSGPAVEIVALPPLKPIPQPTASPVSPEGSRETVQSAARHFALLRGSRAAERMTIGQGGVVGRGPEQVEFVLDHPHVSRRHARLSVDSGRVFLRDLGSANGTFVNGQRLDRPIALKRGDRIDIGPFSLARDGEVLVSRSRANNIELAGRNLKRVWRRPSLWCRWP